MRIIDSPTNEHEDHEKATAPESSIETRKGY